MNELHAMRTFANVVDNGSFANASRAMDVAPAVVTRLVADLEHHLGARLLTRTTRRLALTDIGTQYLERVRVILQTVDEARALARQAQAEPRGSLRVRVPPGFAAQQLTPRLPRFHMAHPRVMLDLAATGPVESIDADHDVTIVVSQSALEGDFVARLLARPEVVLCATPAYLDRHGRPTHPSQLVDHTVLMPASQRPFTLHHRGDRAGVGPHEPVTLVPRRSTLNLVNSDLHLAAATADLGIAGVASFAADDGLRSGRLERVLPDWHLHSLSVWACVPTRQHMPASTRVFLDFLLAEFGGRDCDPWSAPRPAATGADPAPELRVA